MTTDYVPCLNCGGPTEDVFCRLACRVQWNRLHGVKTVDVRKHTNANTLPDSEAKARRFLAELKASRPASETPDGEVEECKALRFLIELEAAKAATAGARSS